jgi:hypothetical protein
MSGESPEELQDRVERQREQLADTIDALSAKLDAKAQARARLDAAQRTVRERTLTPDGRPRTEAVVTVAAVVIAGLALVWWRRR